MGFQWDLYRISMGFIWDLYGASMGFQRDCYGISMILLSGLTWIENITWMLFFSFLVSTCFHWRNKPLPPTLPQTLRGWKRSFRELMSSYIASTSFRVLVGLGDLFPRPRCGGCSFYLMGVLLCFFFSFHDTSAKLSFRGASTPFRACSHTHILTLLWLDEYPDFLFLMGGVPDTNQNPTS